MFKKILCLLITLGCFYDIQAQPSDLVLRSEMTKDTIFIGEPMVIKCILINHGEEIAKVYGAPSRPLLTCSCLSFCLYLPNSERGYRYGVGYLVTSSGRPTFTLEPHDSIYWYSILNWRDWGYSMQKKDMSNLPVGYYRIKTKYYLFSEDLKQRWQINSNIDSFYAIKMPMSEAKIFSETHRLIDNFLNFSGSPEENKMIYRVFPKFLNVKNSIIAQFCHYLLAMNSPLSKRFELCKSFLEKYPNTPLAEEIEFCLARSYAGIGREDLSAQAYKQVLQKYPDNVNGYYYRNLKRKKID